MNLNDRLNRIEAKLRPAPAEDLAIWVQLVSPGQLDRPVTRIKHGGQEWHRLDGETEESFQARARAAAVLPPGGSRLVMIME
jgi:hypothetical protein